MKWLSVGATLALLPALATFPATRLLIAPSLGIAALVASVLSRAWADSGWRRVVGVGWLGLAFVLQPLTAWLTTAEGLRTLGERATKAMLDPNIGPEEQVIVVASTDFVSATYGLWVLSEQRRPLPRTWRVWSMSPYRHTVRRLGPRELAIEVDDGRMLETDYEQLVSAEGRRFHEGDRVQLRGEVVTVTKVEAGAPTAISVELEEPIEVYRLLWWNGAVLADLAPPEVGGSLELPRADTLFEQLYLGRSLGIGLLTGGIVTHGLGIVAIVLASPVWFLGVVVVLAGVALSVVGTILIGSTARARRVASQEQDTIDRQIRILSVRSSHLLGSRPGEGSPERRTSPSHSLGLGPDEATSPMKMRCLPSPGFSTEGRKPASLSWRRKPPCGPADQMASLPPGLIAARNVASPTSP